MVALPTTVLLIPSCDRAAQCWGTQERLSHPSGQKLLRICLTRDSLGWSVNFVEVRLWGCLSPYPESYLVQDLPEASWVLENGFGGYKCILRNSNMKHNLRIMDTDHPGSANS